MDLVESLLQFSPSKLADSSRNVIRELWDKLEQRPGGRALFSRCIGFAAPYTGTIGARVTVLRRGYAEVTMRDRPWLRNHLRSVHAIALANLAELTGNAALAYSLPDNARFIVTGLSLEYKKKARGTIRGICECTVPTDNTRTEYPITVRMLDESGDEVAVATLRSLVGPK